MLLALMLLSPTALADVDGPAWTVQVDPLTAALGFAHVQVERRLADRWSLYAGPHLRVYDGIITEEPEPYTGVGVELGVRRFFKETAPQGTWLQLRTVAAAAWSSEVEGGPGFAGYTSALGGHTWIVGDWLVLAAGLGAQRLYYTHGPYGIEGWLPAAHSTVGVAF